MGESLEGAPKPMERRLEIPVSITPTDAIRAMRVIGESRGWRMHRIEETTMVHRWAIIVPLAKRARVLGLVVDEGEGEGLTLRSWSYVPGSAGRMSFVSFNIPELFEAHFGVLMTGAVLNALNIRLEAETLAYILEHGEAKVLITDREFSPVI